jgi:hypothetical protein
MTMSDQGDLFSYRPPPRAPKQALYPDAPRYRERESSLEATKKIASQAGTARAGVRTRSALPVHGARGSAHPRFVGAHGPAAVQRTAQGRPDRGQRQEAA